MKIRRFIAVCWLLAVAVAGRAQRAEIDLAGVWQSSLGECRLPGTTDENHLGGERAKSGPTSQLTRLYPYQGVVSYERDVEIPKELETSMLLLYIERTKPSTLWVDGDSIGSVRQLFAPHVYRLPHLKAGKHHIRLDIDNRDAVVPPGVHGSHAWTDATQTNWNGMIGRIAIDAKPTTHIVDMHVYPDVEKREAEVRLKVWSERKTPSTVALTLDDGQVALKESCSLAAGKNELVIRLDMGDNVRLWSEFPPDLYTLTAALTTKKTTDQLSRRFGMRQFGTEGTQFVINGKKTFLRGTHDGCVFPLTGYAPADVEQWRRLFSVVKEYGLNHVRFHSYTPTEAAFEAADEMGIYLHTELPAWGHIDSSTVELNDFLRHEAFTTLRFLGNHPSFVGLGLGNELGGDTAVMHRWLDEFRTIDPRHLYCMGANNDLGWLGPKQGEDLYITCRVGYGSNFENHARTSFSFADADHGGMLNWWRPSTKHDFSPAVERCPVPIVSHETCQFQIYPDYRDIPKYTGVLYPYNLETFRERLKENNLSHQIDAFHEATGRWAVECYKADMEQCLRTPGFGGYQLLDLKDYPGQGTSLVGILDAFMDSKGLVEPATFRQWSAPIVPLALLSQRCFTTADSVYFDIVLANYSEADYRQPLIWSLGDRQGEVIATAHQGEVAHVAQVVAPLTSYERSCKLVLHLKTGEYKNSYNLWVYAPVPERPKSDVLEADTLSPEVVRTLHNGGTVLLVPKHGSIKAQSVGGLFTPDYWNYAMFKTISENNHRPASPGTLGMLMDPGHPVFRTFPTEGRTDWQWWCVALLSRPLILNTLPDCQPIIQVVDNIERNHKLGTLMEFRVGKGRLLLCMTDLANLNLWPEGRAYADAVRTYAASDCQPAQTLTIDQLRTLLYSRAAERKIEGVKNLTDYKMQ